MRCYNTLQNPVTPKKLIHNLSEPLCLTRNCIKFELPKGAPGSLTLIDAFSHFEVYVNKAPHDICVHLCPSIWQTLVEGIQKVAETLKYQLFPKQAFLCKHENTRPHLALPAAAFDYWRCKLNPDISGSLKEEQKLWLPKKGNMWPYRVFMLKYNKVPVSSFYCAYNYMPKYTMFTYRFSINLYTVKLSMQAKVAVIATCMHFILVSCQQGHLLYVSSGDYGIVQWEMC